MEQARVETYLFSQNLQGKDVDMKSSEPQLMNQKVLLDRIF